MRDLGRVVIVGAGPTGLGAAWRLHELGHDDFAVLEAAEGPGGLASSVLDEHGYTWDLGGHVQFSHYRYYDDVLDRVVVGGWLEHERESWVWMPAGLFDGARGVDESGQSGVFVPYPFQNNLHRLPREARDLAIAGLEEVARAPRDGSAPRHFRDWIDATFGVALAELFMVPYNEKVWGYPLEELDAGWMGERVAVPDVERIKRNVGLGRDDVSWGPNNRFRFPRRGGTGRIWADVAAYLPQDALRYRTAVVGVDLGRRTVRLERGRRAASSESIDTSAESFDALVSTMPLDQLCARCAGLSPSVAAAAGALRHSSVHVIGLGLDGPRPETLSRKCWMYFPSRSSPYYRVTVFSNYSPENVPPEPNRWSLMAEVCETAHQPVDVGRVVDEVLAALRVDELIPNGTRVVSRWHRRLQHGYPTPFLGRDEVLSAIRPELERSRVFSRGRFGAWRYEVSNQDHSFMQGVELIDRLCGLGEEPTLDDPARVNGGEFLERVAQVRHRSTQPEG